MDLSVSGSMQLSSSTTISLSSTTISLSATNGVSLGDSNLYGFESGTGTVGSYSSAQVILNKMAGTLTSELTDLAVDEVDNIYLYNNRVDVNSIVMVNISDQGGCQPVVLSAKPDSG